MKLLGHIIRAHRYDPLRQVLYEKGTLIPRIEHKRRSGKPRANWRIETYKYAFSLIDGAPDLDFDMNNIDIRTKIHEAAENRIGPFRQETVTETMSRNALYGLLLCKFSKVCF